MYGGLLIDSYFFKGSHLRINKTDTRTTIIRLIVNTVVISVFYVLPFHFFEDYESLITIFCFKYALTSFVAGLYLYGFSKWFNKKLKLI